MDVSCRRKKQQQEEEETNRRPEIHTHTHTHGRKNLRIRISNLGGKDLFCVNNNIERDAKMDSWTFPHTNEFRVCQKRIYIYILYMYMCVFLALFLALLSRFGPPWERER